VRAGERAQGVACLRDVSHTRDIISPLVRQIDFLPYRGSRFYVLVSTRRERVTNFPYRASSRLPVSCCAVRFPRAARETKRERESLLRTTVVRFLGIFIAVDTGARNSAIVFLDTRDIVTGSVALSSRLFEASVGTIGVRDRSISR